MKRFATLALVVAFFVAGTCSADEPVIGGPCEGCEYVFVGLPDTLSAIARIAGVDEPGEPLVIEGTVRNLAGAPVEGIIVYAYHTNAGGIYPRGATRHGALRGWARTDENGQYRFLTIRPGPYPGRNTPQHVHMHVIEPGRVTYYIDSVVFDDDPLLTAARREDYTRGRGGNGICHPEKDNKGVWHVRRDIVLGENIPGYPCERRWTFPVPFYQSISWSPDGSKIAVSAVTTNWDEGYRIFTVGADGSNVTRLETGADSDLYPVWSPDGSSIAFASRRGDNSDIYMMKADGTDITQLTRHEAKDSYPSWSPDGATIAFHSNRGGNYDIYKMGADGSDLQRLTSHPADDYNPAWSPDGMRIAFESDREDPEGDEIYTISPDGSGVSRVVADGVFPTWSPDGGTILFAAGGLFAVGMDGSDPRRLVENAVYGAWSPDGSTIAVASFEFDMECRDRHTLTAFAADGSRRTRILPHGAGHE